MVRGEALAQRRQRHTEHVELLCEPPPAVDGPCVGAPRAHLEVEVLDALGMECLRRSRDELGRDPVTPGRGDDVEVGQACEARARPAREREPDRSVPLGEVREAALHDLADLGELLLVIDLDVCRGRRLALERAPQLVEDREVGVRRAANRHGPMLEDRFRPSRNRRNLLMLCRVGGGHPPRPSPAPFGLRPGASAEATSCRSPNGSYDTRCSSSHTARLRRANRRSAASDTQRSEMPSPT